jgi:CRP-like cAMP-binding protein
MSLLHVIKSLISLTEAEEVLVSRLFKERIYKRGEYFLEEGKVCNKVGFVEQGIVRYYINDEGEEKNYDFAQEGQFVCDMESFAPQIPARKNIQALEDSKLMVISYDDLQEFYARLKYGDRFGRMIIEQVFVKTLQDLNSFYTESPEVRYRKFLDAHYDIDQRISQYHVASYLGVKPQSLSRIRKRIVARR